MVLFFSVAPVVEHDNNSEQMFVFQCRFLIFREGDEEVQQLEPTEVQRRLEETFGESAVEYEDADEESEGGYEDPTMVWTKFAEDQYTDIQPACSIDEKGEIFIDYSTKKAVC